MHGFGLICLVNATENRKDLIIPDGTPALPLDLEYDAVIGRHLNECHPAFTPFFQPLPFSRDPVHCEIPDVLDGYGS